jgi:holo-[acyl-carrier protein] synthase
MIVGIGTDIIEVSRIEKALSRHGQRFIERIYSQREAAYCEALVNRAQRYATRFAAKEAARKALGAAVPVKALDWHDVEIISSSEGAPQLEFYGQAADFIRQLGVTRSHVSLSHSATSALAFVILEK